MQKTNAKTIKGLSIACIIFSALMLILYVICGVALIGIAGYSDAIVSSVNSYDPSSIYDYGYGGHDHSYGYGNQYYYGYGDTIADDITDSQILILVSQLGFFFVGIAFIMEAVSLVSAIIIFINSNRPEKLGFAFGWGIAGAILSFVSAGIIQTALFVIAVVFIYKDRELYKRGQYPITVPAPQATYSAGSASVQAQPTNTNQANIYSAPVPGTNQDVPPSNAASYSAQNDSSIEANVPASPVINISDTQQIDPQSQQTIQTIDEFVDPSSVEEVSTDVVEIHPEGNIDQPNISDEDTKY